MSLSTSSLMASSSRGDEGDDEATTGSEVAGRAARDDVGENDGRKENDDEMVEDREESELESVARVGGSEEDLPRSFSRARLPLSGESSRALFFLRSSSSFRRCHSLRSERITRGISTLIIHFCQPLLENAHGDHSVSSVRRRKRIKRAVPLREEALSGLLRDGQENVEVLQNLLLEEDVGRG